MADRVTHSLVKRLRAVPEFATLDDRTLLRIVGASANLAWKPGSLVFEKGSPADALYMVIAGRIGVFDVVDGREVLVAEIGPDGYFGELSLLTKQAHSKSARAMEETELMAINGAWFEELLANEPRLARYFEDLIESRRGTVDTKRHDGAEAAGSGSRRADRTTGP